MSSMITITPLRIIKNKIVTTPQRTINLNMKKIGKYIIVNTYKDILPNYSDKHKVHPPNDEYKSAIHRHL